MDACMSGLDADARIGRQRVVHNVLNSADAYGSEIRITSPGRGDLMIAACEVRGYGLGCDVATKGRCGDRGPVED